MMLRARSLCILARREAQFCSPHALRYTNMPSLLVVLWCAGASMPRMKIAAAAATVAEPVCPRLPFESFCVPPSARLRRRRNHISSHRQNLHALCPLGLSERPQHCASYFPRTATAHLREGVRLNPRSPLQYHSSLFLFYCRHLPCR
jgi:hypothetical protein